MAWQEKHGRPSKYDEGMIAKVDEYLETCVDEVETFHKTVGDKSNSYERVLKVNLPKIEGFAQYIDVSLFSLYKWSEESQEFSEALDKIRKAQHNKLVDGAISGNYNPTIAKLMLSRNHGYKEKSDVTTNDEKIESGVVILPAKDND